MNGILKTTRIYSKSLVRNGLFAIIIYKHLQHKLSAKEKQSQPHYFYGIVFSTMVNIDKLMVVLTMIYKDSLYEGFWWLSLFGGVNCIGLSLYLCYLYFRRNTDHRLLAAIFSLVGVYFLTGLFNKENSPLPLQLLFVVIIPIYFLLMPILYLYVSKVLLSTKRHVEFYWHFLPASIITITIGVTFIYCDNFRFYIFSPSQDMFSHITFMGKILPMLLSIQIAIYFYLIFLLLKQAGVCLQDIVQSDSKGIKLQWLVALIFATLSNWLIRVVSVLLPFYFNDQITVIMLFLARVGVLFSVYILVIFGFSLAMTSSYLGRAGAPKSINNTAETSKKNILDTEEINFLQKIMQEKP